MPNCVKVKFYFSSENYACELCTMCARYTVLYLFMFSRILKEVLFSKKYCNTYCFIEPLQTTWKTPCVKIYYLKRWWVSKCVAAFC
jgi:hypothetical protein